MAFRFRLDEPIVKGFRRIGVEQIERALKELAAESDHVTAVHESRKCLKRIRALLRLGRVGLGEEVFHAENARFRSIAADLAPARDHQVTLETVVALAAEAEPGSGAHSSLCRIKAELVQHRSEASEDTAPDPRDEARAALERAVRRFRRLKLEPDTFSVLTQGLTRSYRRGVKGLEATSTSDDAEAFHEWRKAVQTHWRHMSLMSRIWPELFAARIDAARELSQLLGEDHDLAILSERLPQFESEILSPGEAEDIARHITSRQRILRAAARPRGQLLFAEGTKAHGRRIAAMWDAAVARSRADAELAEKTEIRPAPAVNGAPVRP